jgi:hypothetical protein
MQFRQNKWIVDFENTNNRIAMTVTQYMFLILLIINKYKQQTAWRPSLKMFADIKLTGKQILKIHTKRQNIYKQLLVSF